MGIHGIIWIISRCFAIVKCHFNNISNFKKNKCFAFIKTTDKLIFLNKKVDFLLK